MTAILIVAAFAVPSTAAPALGLVSRISDPRVVESSGLAASYRYPDLAYTINDNSEDRQTIYAFRISTGQVVGTTVLKTAKRGDTESIYADPSGQIWLGDLGDNDGKRTDASILRFTEPGPGNHVATNLVRFPVKYDSGKPNVEAMIVNPLNSRVYLVSKRSSGARLYVLPAKLSVSETNIATRLDVAMPTQASDAVLSRDGLTLIVRTDDNIQFISTLTAKRYATMELPYVPNPESITIDPDQTTFLYGSEGKNSPVYRYRIPG